MRLTKGRYYKFENTANYITFRLKVAQRAEPTFTDEAIKLIYDNSGGIPRKINRLCELCLLAGFAQKVKIIDEEIVQKVIKV